MATYDIKISGHNDLLAVVNGEKMKEDWEKYKMKKAPDVPVSIANWTGMLSDIKWFRSAKSSRADDESGVSSDREYREDLKKIRAMTPKQKSQRLGFFRVIHVGFIGEQPTDETLAKAQEIQKEFFDNNPQRTLCDPVNFKPILESSKCNDAAMRVIESHIRQDKFAVKYL